MNTHEQFITLETAKLAKQAGFDWKARAFYLNGEFNRANFYENYNNCILADCKTISAPIQSILQRWLREVKGWEVFVEVKYRNSKEYVCRIETSEYGCNTDFYSTFEAALEAGLKQCLTLLVDNL